MKRLFWAGKGVLTDPKTLTDYNCGDEVNTDNLHKKTFEKLVKSKLLVESVVTEIVTSETKELRSRLAVLGIENETVKGENQSLVASLKESKEACYEADCNLVSLAEQNKDIRGQNEALAGQLADFQNANEKLAKKKDQGVKKGGKGK